MPFAEIDTAGVARALAQIVELPDDRADVFFERREEIALPSENVSPGLQAWREAGLAVRLERGDQVWLAARDVIDAETFRDAVRRVARAMPRAAYPLPRLRAERWLEAPEAPEVLAFPDAVRRAVRERQAKVRYRLTVRRHRRSVLIIGSQLTSPIEEERFYSVTVELSSTRFGALLATLDLRDAEEIAEQIARAARCHDATPPEAWRGPCVLGPAAAAVLLHEAVAHALEADTLALGGHPDAAVGVALGVPSLNVLDDPGSAPEGVRRSVDDEGVPVLRRWLLRDGIVEQPLCDSSWARRSEVLAAGAGRRGNRHEVPAPRSTHLELLPGELAHADLFDDADGGLYLPQAARGSLDPLSGRFVLHFPYGRRIGNRAPGQPVGPCVLRGQVSGLLQAVVGIGRETRPAGAGWCAKGGMKLPVWATAPAIRLEGVEVSP